MTTPIRPLQDKLKLNHPLRNTSIEQLGQIRDSVVAEEATKQGVPVHLALAVAKVENTRGIPWVVSRTGDIGVMQINPRAHPETPVDSLSRPGINARVGVSILAHYKQRYGTWDRALMAYNGALKKPNAGAEYVRLVRAQMAALGALATSTQLSE